MSSQYANPTGQEMHDFLSAVGLDRDDHLEFDDKGYANMAKLTTKERTYSRIVKSNDYGDDVYVVVYTTINKHTGQTRRKGSDAIRAILWSNEFGFVKGTKRVNRTPNWRLNLLKRIETLEDSL